MALRKVVTSEDPVLRKTSRKVEKFDQKLFDLLDDMKDTMEDAQGVGLAAVQVGILRQVVVIDVGDGLIELINPEIVETSGEEEDTEGCLSVPNQWGLVKRPTYAKVKAQNRKGQWFWCKGEGLKARCLCHELDHLKGVIFTDYVENMLTEDEFIALKMKEMES